MVLKVELGSILRRRGCLGILFLCLAVSAALFVGVYQPSQPLIATIEQTERNARGETTLHGELFTGELVTYYPDGSFAERTNYVDGRREGLSRSWFANGVLGFQAEYVNGRKHGLVRSWWNNGNLRTQEYRDNGRREGEGLSWYASGALFKKTNHEDGRVTGMQQIWRENGKLSSNFEYRNGRRYGLFKADPCIGVEDEVLSLDYYREQASGIPL